VPGQSGALGQSGQVALQVSALTASVYAHHIHALMALVPCATIIALTASAPAHGIHALTRFRYLRRDKSLSFFIGFFGSMSLSFSCCTALFFLLRVSPTGFTAEVLMRPLGLYVFHFSSFMACLCRSVLLACLLPRSAARGEVLQYLTRSALSRVESRHIRVFRLFTFPAFLSKTRQYTQDFIVPSNFHHNLDSMLRMGQDLNVRIQRRPQWDR